MQIISKVSSFLVGNPPSARTTYCEALLIGMELDKLSKVQSISLNMEEENVTGYVLGISFTCTALRYKSAFIATC